MMPRRPGGGGKDRDLPIVASPAIGTPRDYAELAPYIEQALERKQYLRPLGDEEIPVVRASRERETFYYKD